MALHRYTKEDCETLTDLEMLRAIIQDRKSTCTNYYTPLYKRLTALYNKVSDLIESGQKELRSK